jgi:SAM-dependent methyltransferase
MIKRISFSRRIFLHLRKLLFPGLDISTRKRLRFTQYFCHGDIKTLDAGCGNGAFSFEAYRRGNRVLGIGLDEESIRKCEEFRDFLGYDSTRIRFRVQNLYDLEELGENFDQIICFEVLEHLKEDRKVLEIFFAILNPGGILHISTPRADRKPYFSEVISSEEDGSHVRLGYREADLRNMLKEAGFDVIRSDSAVGILSFKILESMHFLEKALERLPSFFRFSLMTVLLFILYPVTWLDFLFGRSKDLHIYLEAIKPKNI